MKTIYKLCPAWRRHINIIWNLNVVKTHWYCKHCPLININGIGRAYRRTIEKETIYDPADFTGEFDA